jgi:hypothetical protein
VGGDESHRAEVNWAGASDLEDWMGGSEAKLPGKVPVARPGSGQDCPSRFTTIVSGPADGIIRGAWLEVRVDRSGVQPRVVLVDEITSAIVGSLAGVPNLAILIRCLEEGVPYRAIVDHVDGGRVDITVLQG